MTDSTRVLELGRGTASAWAGRLLAEAGADVLKVFAPDGPRLPGPLAHTPRDGVALAQDLGKRGVALDITTAANAPALERLLAWADILVLDHGAAEAHALGLDAARLRERHPGLVVLSITPFGVEGPRAHYQATELTIAHGGGWASLCPATHQDPGLPPLKVHGQQCARLAATSGVVTALAVLRDARRSGVGDFIDMSEQAYIASVLESAVPVVGYRELVPYRHHPRSLLPWRIFEASDGPVYLVCIEQDQRERLVQFMGNPEWAQLEIFVDMPSRAANQDVLHSLLQEFIAGWEVMPLVHAAQAHRICIAPVMGYAQLRAAEHLHARDFFGSLSLPDDAGARNVALMRSPVLTTRGRAALGAPLVELAGAHDAIERAAPRARGSASPARRPLEGIRVVDLSWAWAGPFCAMNLAHLGADVIRLESTTRPDLYRRLPIVPAELEPTLDTSGMFNQWNQGKRSVAVALATPEGRQVVRDFVANSDVVVQNFATGVLDRLGLGYDELRRINPRIVLASISGYGQTGPWRAYMGYGPSAAALTGLCSVTGYVDGGPEELGLSMPDPTAGITAAYGVLAALARRDVSGEGEHIDVSLWEASAVLGLDAWMQHELTGEQPPRIGNRAPDMAPHGCYRCLGDEAWVTLACRNDGEWQRLAALVDPALARDPRFATLALRKANEDALDALLQEWTLPQDRWAVTRVLQALGIPAFPSQSCRDVVDDPHLNARGFVERLPHPAVGARPHTGIPWRLAARPNGVRMPARCIGADTDTALREVAGYDAGKIAALRAAGVLT